MEIVMIVSLWMAEDGGMLFNNRRISRDSEVISDLGALASDSVIFISDFSSKLFRDAPFSVIESSNPLECAGAGDYVFIENLRIKPYIEKTEKLIIYKWGDKYPSDFKFDISPEKEGFKLCESYEFSGKAHEKITREIWIR